VKLPRLRLTGFVGWAFWDLAHVYFLIGLRNRIAVAFSWAWDHVTFGRRARLITEPADAKSAAAEPEGPSGMPSAFAIAEGGGVPPARGAVWG
jgi:NADH dehydrogenase